MRQCGVTGHILTRLYELPLRGQMRGGVSPPGDVAKQLQLSRENTKMKKMISSSAVMVDKQQKGPVMTSAIIAFKTGWKIGPGVRSRRVQGGSV